MPIKVPIYETQVDRVTPHLETPRAPTKVVPGVVRGAFGENVYAANQEIAKAGEKIAGHLLQMAQDEQDKEVLKRETAFRQDLQLKLSDPATETINVNGQQIERPKGYLSRELGQAKGVTQEFDDYYYKQLREQYAKGLSKYQLAKLAPAMDNYYTSTRGNLITHEARELDKDFEQETKSNVEQKILDASLIRDSKTLGLAIDDAIQSAAPFYRKFGPMTKKVLNEKIAEGIVKSSVIATIERSGDYVQAKAMLDGIKDKLPDSVYNSINDEIGKRAVDISIAGDMSVRQEDSEVMSELQKGKDGIFSFLSTTERNKAIKESQQKIFYNSQIQQRDIKEQQSIRNDEMLNKIDSLTLADIENEMSIPEEQGGLPKKVLVNYKRAIQRGIEKDLNQMLKERDNSGDPTKKANAVKQYVDLIDSFIDDNIDKWYAREKLSAAYADGIINKGEALFLNNLKKNLNDIEFNRSTGPINSAIKGLKNWLKQNNASDEEIAIRIKQLLERLRNKGNPTETVKTITQEHLKDKLPEVLTIPETGQLMMDGYGNKAMVFPDGHIEPYIEKPKTKEAKPQEKE